MIRVFVSSLALESLVRASAALELVESEEQAEVLLSDNEETEQTGLPTVLLLDTPDPARASAALRSGIRGVLSREATPEEIESAIQAVNAGLIVLTPEAIPTGESPAEPLSDREREVLDLIAEGLSNKLIAHRLNISEHTVKTHVAAILAKFGAGSRTEAVSQAIRRGLVML